MTTTQQVGFHRFPIADHLVKSIAGFIESVHENNIAALEKANTITLVAKWTKRPSEEKPAKEIMDNISLLSSSAVSWTKIEQFMPIEHPDFQELMVLLIDKIPAPFRAREADYINRMKQKDYSFFVSEVTNILVDDQQLAYQAADLLEKAMNIVKIKEIDPLESRKVEDFQWSLIEAKRTLLELQLSTGKDAERNKTKLKEIIYDLQDKMRAGEETDRALTELGLKESLRELTAEKLPNGRVRLGWKKSG